MRRLGCLLVVLLALGIGGYFADQAVTSYAEERTEEQVKLTVDAETDVEFDGWPVTLRLLAGMIPTATLRSTDVPLDNGAVLDRLDVVLTNVEVDVSDLRNNPRRLPPAEEGTFRARISAKSLAEVLQIPPDVAALTLSRDTVTLEAAGLEVDAEVVADDGDVVVRLKGPLAQVLGGAELPIDLSDEPGSPYVEDVTIRDGVMVVRGRLEEVNR